MLVFFFGAGTPLVNATKFPDLKELVQYGDSKGILVGWYQINCICCDEFTDTGNVSWKAKVYAADVKQLTDAGFHGVKVRGVWVISAVGPGSGSALLSCASAAPTHKDLLAATAQASADCGPRGRPAAWPAMCLRCRCRALVILP